MISLIFDNLSIKNFLSIREAKLNLSNQGLVLLEGVNDNSTNSSSNGSGKSSILDAIVWCLEDELISHDVPSKDDVVLDTRGCDAEVIQSMRLDNKVLEVTRYRRHIQYGNALRLSLDGHDITYGTPTQTQHKLDQLLQIPFEVLSQVIILGQDLPNRFTNLSDESKKSFLELLCNVQRWDKVAEVNKSVYNSLLNRQIELRTKLDSDRLAIERDKKGFDSYELMRLKYENESKEKLVKIENEAINLESCLGEIQGTLSWRRDKLSSISTQINKYDDEERSLSYNLKVVQLGLDSWTSAKSSLAVNLNKIQDSVIECPLCLRPFIDSDPHSNVVTHYNEEVAKFDNSIESIKISVSTTNSELNTIRLILTDLRKLYGECEIEVSNLEKEVIKVTRSLDSLKSEKEVILRQSNPYDEVISSLSSSLLELKASVEKLQSELDSINSDIRYHSYLAEVFSPKGIRSWLLDEGLVEVNDILVRESESLFDDSQVKIVPITSTKGGKDISRMSIWLCGDKKRPYGLCSGGERRAIDLAIQLAFHEFAIRSYGLRVNLLALDESLDKLDPVRQTHVVQLLEKKLEDGLVNTIILVSHVPLIRSMVPKVWTVRKSLGESVLIGGD